MEYRVLGPLEVVAGDGSVRLGGRKQRLVLAHLLIRPNDIVSTDVLISEVWGDEPPESVRSTLQGYVSHLRRALGAAQLEGRDGGYILRVARDEIDASRFEAIVRDAKAMATSDPAAAAARLSDALALWRGPAFADLADELSLRGEIARLEELRLSAIEHRVAAEIAMGGHSTVVSELEALTARHPLRERMWAHLMLALYRLGRPAEALATFQRAREVLSSQLGVEPSAELQRLHEQILRRDPALGKRERARPGVPTSRIDLAPGTEFAGYRIVRTLGRGGMSVVYLAEHDWLQRKVALKVLAPQLAEDDRFRERFVRESRLAASLDHPNVIPIYEAGGSGGDLFIAMRYVEGTDLRTLLHEEGALDPARAVAIVRQVAAALDAAHEEGLVHRDVKPGNVLLARPRGEAAEHVYLSDFGLTKRSASDSGMTGTGQFVGTLDYAAPEQFEGGTIDARTDVYSLGCVLFECLTGRPPFTAENEPGLMYAHLQQEPPAVTSVVADLNREVDGVVIRAMAKASTERQPSAGALAVEAARALGVGEGTSSQPASARQRWRGFAVAAALAVALVAGVVVSSLFQGETPLPTDSVLPTATPSPTAAPAFRTVERALTADEERLIDYIPEEINGECLPLDRAEPVRGELASLVCRASELEVLYQLFPTRSQMDDAFDVQVNLQQARGGECATDRLAVTTYTVGGERTGRVLCYAFTEGGFFDERPEQSHIQWTDENASIYAHAVRNDLGDLTLYEWWLSSAGPIVPTGDGELALVKDRPDVLTGVRPRDGTYLVRPRGGCAGVPGFTCALRVDDTTYEIFFVGDLAASETGEILLRKPESVVFIGAGGYCFEGGRDVRPAIYSWTGSGDQLSWRRTGGGTCVGPSKLTDRPWTRAPSGTIVFEQQGEIALTDPGGAEVERLALDAPTVPNKNPEWSPDGTRIVFAGATEHDNLYVMNADGTGFTQLTNEVGNEYDPAWSPDGTRIAFGYDNFGFEEATGGAYGRSSIVMIDAGGEHRTELVTMENERLGWPAWSPGGTEIAFSAYSDEGADLYVMTSDGTDVRKIHEQPRGLFAMPVSWTPDGDRIVFWGHRTDGTETLLSVRPDGTDIREVAGDLPADASTLVVDWSPDGRWMIAAGMHDLTTKTTDASFVYLIRADGSDSFAILGSGYEPSWRPEDR